MNNEITTPDNILSAQESTESLQHENTASLDAAGLEYRNALSEQANDLINAQRIIAQKIAENSILSAQVDSSRMQYDNTSSEQSNDLVNDENFSTKSLLESLPDMTDMGMSTSYLESVGLFDEEQIMSTISGLEDENALHEQAIGDEQVASAESLEDSILSSQVETEEFQDENMLSQDENTLSENENMLFQDENVLSQDENVLSQDENVLSQDENVLSQDENILTSQLDDQAFQYDSMVTQEENLDTEKSIISEETMEDTALPSQSDSDMEYFEHENTLSQDESDLIAENHVTTTEVTEDVVTPYVEKNDLSEREQALIDRENALIERENILIERENALSLKTQKIVEQENSFNKKAEELESLELQAKNDFPELFANKFAGAIKQITVREESVTERENALTIREGELASFELQARNGFKTLLEERNNENLNQIMAREDALVEREKAIVAREEASREQISEDKARAAKDLIEYQRVEKDKIHEDLVEEREKLYNQLDEEVSRAREQRLNAVQEDIDAQYRRSEIYCAEEKAKIDQEKNRIDEESAKLAQEKAKIDQDKQAILQREEEQSKLDSELRSREIRLENREADVASREILVEERVSEHKKEVSKQYELRIAELEESNDSLRDYLASKNDELAEFDEFKIALGGKDVATINQKWKEKSKIIISLREELAKCPSADLQHEYERLQKREESLILENRRLTDELDRSAEISRVASSLKIENQAFKSTNRALEESISNLEETLARVRPSKNPDELNNRIRAIEVPEISPLNGPFRKEDSTINNMSEIDWLTSISDKCKSHGIIFPKRILLAYHTALKTAEWSPITILSGISGTGKSELPKLYAHFGGINFINVPVQPNWNCQESMLGSFNSIDNRFDAQPLLRFLAQSAKDTEISTDTITGLRKFVSLVLLDEMNLSHVERYFAKFLSKLEDRRSYDFGCEPQIKLKLGSDIDQLYSLDLVRNVLWSGTMDQDGTAKPLPDRVVDRGIIINLPRPTSLESRKAFQPLTVNTDANSMLLHETWSKWIKHENTFEADSYGQNLLAGIKLDVEKINDHMSVAGKAIGHRAWQSIEHYILNYPTVISADSDSKLEIAMQTAFEDQIVHKIMPKLRGIETRGRKKKDCLDKIGNILENRSSNLMEDFRFACDAGDGQFIWSSAYYINKEIDQNTEIL